MTILTQKDAAVFIQFRLGDKEFYLGDCTDLDAIGNPRVGGIDHTFCWNGKRNGFKSYGKKYTPPGNIEVTITQLLDETRAWLDKIHCPFTLYAMKRTCGEAGVFGNWERGAILYDAELISDEFGSYASHVDDNETTHAYTISSAPPRIDVWNLNVARQTTTETQDLECVAPCMNLFCDDDCGEYTIPGDNIIAGSAGALAAKAKVDYTQNAGALWASSAAQPWANAEVIKSIACFEMTKGTNRWLAARGSTAAKGFEVAWSDDLGATWHVVPVIATVTEGVAGPKGLFALDYQHIWAATSEGNVFFSDDGGVSWTNQNALGASAGVSLHAINAADEDTVVAVGESDTVIYSYDGGDHWAAASATGSGDDLLSVTAFNKWRWLIGSDGAAALTSSLFITYDGGTTYAQRNFSGSLTEEVTDMSFCAPGVGLIITNSMTSFGSGGSIHLTVDGGWSWVELVTPANKGLNAVTMIDPTDGFVVGEVDSGTAVIFSVGI